MLQAPKSPLVLEAVDPLLRALATASGPGGSSSLADRLTKLMVVNVAKCRPALAVAGEAEQTAAVERVEKLWKRVLYHASRGLDPRVVAAAGELLLMLISTAVAAGGAFLAVAQAAAEAAVADFLGKKKSKLQRPLLERLLQRCPEAVASGQTSSTALTKVLQGCSKPRNEYLQSEALQLLAASFKLPLTQQQQLLLPGLKAQGSEVAAALGAGVLGPYKNADRHVTAVKAVKAVCAAALKALGPGKRLADALGPDAATGLAKAVLVLRVSGSKGGWRGWGKGSKLGGKGGRQGA